VENELPCFSQCDFRHFELDSEKEDIWQLQDPQILSAVFCSFKAKSIQVAWVYELRFDDEENNFVTLNNKNFS